MADVFPSFRRATSRASVPMLFDVEFLFFFFNKIDVFVAIRFRKYLNNETSQRGKSFLIRSSRVFFPAPYAHEIAKVEALRCVTRHDLRRSSRELVNESTLLFYPPMIHYTREVDSLRRVTSDYVSTGQKKQLKRLRPISRVIGLTSSEHGTESLKS